MPPTKYTAEILAPIVASSTSLSDVMRKLGLEPNGGNHRLLQARIRLAGLDTSHFTSRTYRARIDGIGREQLAALATDSFSIAEVLAKLSLPTKGRAFFEMKRRLDELAIDVSHFRGQGWAFGHTRETHPAIGKVARRLMIPDEKVRSEWSTAPRPSLVKRLLAKGWDYRCAICGIDEWCGKRLVLHLDHITGINNDNRVENLRLLCPNCHSQTPTYCNRARERRACYTWRHASVTEWQTL
jgi:5-methylcytosine-specific restriction endonuclease McrA